MPRFGGRSNSLRPVNSIKHILDVSGSLTGGFTSASPIAVAVPNVDTSVFKPGDIRVGATINGFYISIFVIGSTGSAVVGPQDWYLWKSHTGQTAVQPIPGQTGTSEVRNQIIHEEKGLVGSGDGTAMAFKGVIAIPRSMRRMREGDLWEVRLRNSDTTNDTNFCVKAIYKSYF